ncbi:hypothetical protein AALA56_09850 [Streptococcus hyointestinalis]|uniref:hypothetical protein n=1 Tax=Streptococcus hyointestinalis TaxID=1337 RepID=UPI003513232C
MENLLKSATATQADVDSATKKASALSKALQGAMVVGDDGLANQSISNHNLSADVPTRVIGRQRPSRPQVVRR